MIDRDAVEAGKAAMKLELYTRRTDGRILFLGEYADNRPARLMPDSTEVEGRIDIGELAEAFMRGAGIQPVKDVAQLQGEVDALRQEVADLRAATAPLIPRQPALSPQRQALQDRFTPLSGAPLTPPSGGPSETKD